MSIAAFSSFRSMPEDSPVHGGLIRLHRAPIPEEEPQPGEEPTPDDEEQPPHPDPSVAQCAASS